MYVDRMNPEPKTEMKETNGEDRTSYSIIQVHKKLNNITAIDRSSKLNLTA